MSQLQRNNGAIAKLLEAEELGKKKIEQAREQGTLQIKAAKEQAVNDIKTFEGTKRMELDAQRKENEKLIEQTKQNLDKKVEQELASIREYANEHMKEAVDLLVNTVFDV